MPRKKSISIGTLIEDLKGGHQTYTKILNKMLKPAEIKHEESEIQSNLHDPKTLWKNINLKINKKK